MGYIIAGFLLFVLVVVILHFQALLKKEKLKIPAALKQSRSVIRGQVTEEFIPLFKDFPYILSDCKFNSKPIDYLVFNGMSQYRDTGKGEIEVVLADVKFNNSRSSAVQNAIKEAVEAKRVRFEVWSVDKDNNLKIK